MLRGVSACREVMNSMRPLMPAACMRRPISLREEEAGAQVGVDHRVPGRLRDGERAVGLAPRRRSGMHEDRDGLIALAAGPSASRLLSRGRR